MPMIQVQVGTSCTCNMRITLASPHGMLVLWGVCHAKGTQRSSLAFVFLLAGG